MKLVELLGPQPILNLLAIRSQQPDEILFVGTRQTHDVGRHLQNMLSSRVKVHQTELLLPHDPFEVHKAVAKKIRKLGWAAEEIILDLSDGTKAEAFGLVRLARDLQCPVIDVELIRGRYRLRRYNPAGDHLVFHSDDPLLDLITIGDYLQAYLPGFEVGGAARDDRGQVDIGGRFEETIYHVLSGHVDEILAGVRPAGVSEQIEIDIIVRRENRVGIIEAKTGVKKAGIDQLSTAGNPHYIGEHVVKFLVTGRYLPRAHKMLAVAEEIHVVELPGYRDHSRLPANEERLLVDTVVRALDGC